MIDHAPLRVAFTNIPRRLWAGGYNYQSNLFVALNRYCPGEIAPVVFAGMSDDSAELAALARIPGVEVVQSPAFDRRRSGLVAALAFGLDQAAVSRISGQTYRSCVRNRSVFRLASAVSGSRMVSGFSASPAAAAFFASRPMASRSRLSRPDCVWPPHYAEQRKRASRLSKVLSELDQQHLGGSVCDAARARPSDREPSATSSRNMACRQNIFICRTSSGGTRIIRSWSTRWPF